MAKKDTSDKPLLWYRFLGAILGFLLALQWMDPLYAFFAGVLGGYFVLSIFVELLFGLIGSVRRTKRMNEALSGIEDWGEIVQIVNHEASKLTSWETEFIDDLISKEAEKPNFIADKASNKQIGKLITIYLERVKGIKLKNREYAIKWTDPKTGIEREITYGEQS